MTGQRLFSARASSECVVTESGRRHGRFPGAEIARGRLKQCAMVLIDIRVAQALAGSMEISYRDLDCLVIPLSGHAVLS